MDQINATVENSLNEYSNLLKNTNNLIIKFREISHKMHMEILKQQDNSIEIAQNIACSFYKSHVISLRMNIRAGKIVEMRRLYFFICCEFFEIPYADIARSLGYPKRETVYYNVGEMINIYETDKEMRRKMDKIFTPESMKNIIERFKSKKRKKYERF